MLFFIRYVIIKISFFIIREKFKFLRGPAKMVHQTLKSEYIVP